MACQVWKHIEPNPAWEGCNICSENRNNRKSKKIRFALIASISRNTAICLRSFLTHIHTNYPEGDGDFVDVGEPGLSELLAYVAMDGEADNGPVQVAVGADVAWNDTPDEWQQAGKVEDVEAAVNRIAGQRKL